MQDGNRPLYTIATAAELLEVHPRTLRLYETAGLIKPARRNGRRLFSKNDLHWLRCIRFLIHQKGLTQEGIRRLLVKEPCWELRSCPAEVYAQCGAFGSRTRPCWSLMEHERQRQAGQCFECPVYLGAREQICCEEERQEALAFGPELP